MAIDVAWPHRFVLREACDLCTAAQQVRNAWLDVIDDAAIQHEAAIIWERQRGLARPAATPGTPPRHSPGKPSACASGPGHNSPCAMSNELCEVCLEAYMRMIFLADEADPEHIT